MHYERGGEPLQAAFQWAEVGARALSRGAAREALQAARQGQALIATRSDEPTPAAALLELTVLEAISLSRLDVVSSPAVAEAFERACAMAPARHGGAARARAMHGRWWVHYARGELAEALPFAQSMLDCAELDQDSVLERAGRSALGNTLAMMGRFDAARTALEAVIASPPVPTGVFVQDLGVEARAQLALVLWWQGEPRSARRLAASAVELAEDVGHPISQLVALNMAAAMHHHAGEFDIALPLNERIFEVIRHHGLPRGLGSFLWLHGSLLARRGQVDEGLSEMHTAGASCETLGMRIGLSAYHLHLADVLFDTGRIDDAEASLRQGLAVTRATQESFLLSPLLRLRAEVKLARGDIDGFETELRLALEAARERVAPFQELLSLVTAARRPQGLQRAERDRLEALLERYEGESSPWVERARALLR
jgi:tetratricopeptide (TPR) repeat protein